MNQKIKIGGKDMTLSALYPWASTAMTRALIFYAEAVKNTKDKFASSIFIYYCLMNLTMAMGLLCPSIIPKKDLVEINEALKDGSKDPGNTLSHSMMRGWINAFVEKGLHRKLVVFFEKALRLRIFINYGPRTKWTGGPILIDT